VAAYLHQRFAGKACPPELARLLHQRTQGNPLFLVTVVDDAVRRGVLREGTTGVDLEGGVEAVVSGVPDSLRQLIEQQTAGSPRALIPPTSRRPKHCWRN
jgi:hypothetical protein